VLIWCTAGGVHPHTMRTCPICKRPSAQAGRFLAVGSNDSTRGAIVGICPACVAAEKTLPKTARLKRQVRAADVAMSDPARFLCRPFDSPDAARLALALLDHPDHSAKARELLGWS
jgi:hypothetical protein